MTNQNEENAVEQRMKKQTEEMEKMMLEAIIALTAPRQNFNSQKPSHAEAVRTAVDENREDESISVMQVPQCDSMSEGQRSRQDYVKILKLAEKRQLSLFERGGQQVMKKMECESNYSLVHLDVYIGYLRKKGQDVDRRALAKALRAKRTLVFLIKDRERRAFGPVQLTLEVDFVEIVTTAWVLMDDDMAGQIFVGRNELSLRAIGPATGARSATIDGEATMSV